jgi:hypothetical protein
LLAFLSKGCFSWHFLSHFTEVNETLSWQSSEYAEILNLCVYVCVCMHVCVCVHFGEQDGDCLQIGAHSLETHQRTFDKLGVQQPLLSTPVRITVLWDKWWKTSGIEFYPALGNVPSHLCWCFLEWCHYVNRGGRESIAYKSN